MTATVLPMQIGSGFQTSRCRFSSLARNPAPGWLPVLALTLLGGFGAATGARALRAPPAGSASEPTAAAQPAATSVTPLPRFVPRDNLIFHLDFDGLDAHAEAWQKTAAYKMLNQTPLGVMLGKAGCVLVVVPRGSAADAGWVWWPEKEDLVIGFMQPSNSDAIIAALDGKAPSAADHAILKELARPEGSFVPLMTAIIDLTAAPAQPRTRMTEFFDQLKSTTGLSRLDYRWGFDDDALMSVSRLVAPTPRKSAMAIFEQPPLDTKNLIPMPEGVESFAMMSLSPARALEAVSQIGPPGELKAKIDELMEKIRSQSRIDFHKDLLSNLGPRMAIYLVPGRSAAPTDEAPQAPAGLAGLDPMAMLSSL